MFRQHDILVWFDYGYERELHVVKVINRSKRKIRDFPPLRRDSVIRRDPNLTHTTGDVAADEINAVGDNADARYAAYVETVGGGERFRGLQTTPETTHMVVTRHPQRHDMAVICECKETGTL